MQIRRTFQSLVCLPLAFAGAAALAQPGAATAPRLDAPASTHGADDVVNPAAPVPALQYRSVFADTPTGVETQEADWKKSNAEVGQFRRGHIDILRWEAGQKGKP